MSTRAEDILDSLPHRPPFRFITDGLELFDGQAGKAVWRVTGDEFFFAGHFPGSPIVPGVLIGEALAQLCGLVVVDRQSTLQAADGARLSPSCAVLGKLAHLDLRFNRTVTPPADIGLESKLERVIGKLWQFDAAASLGGDRVAHGTLTLAIAGDGAADPAKRT